MRHLLMFEIEPFMNWLDILLRDDNGISGEAFGEIRCMLNITLPELSNKLGAVVDATDGRFYIADNAPALVTLLD